MAQTNRPTLAQALDNVRNTLGLSRNELDVVHELLDKNAGSATSQKRQSARLTFREMSVPMSIVQPGGGQTIINVACRNLSRTGMAFLHSSYLHLSTKSIVTLPHNSSGPVRIPGIIVRCRHVYRHIHEVGLRFERPINVRDYVQLDTLSQSFTCEVVDPTQLKGNALIIADYKIEQSCIQSMLSDTGLEFLSASTIEMGLKEAVKGVDIIICDYLFESGTGIDFIKQARERGVRCPVIIMSADRSPDARNKIRQAHADGFLAKPVEKEVLLRALAEFLLGSGESTATPASTGPLMSTLPNGSPMLALANDFVKDVHKCAEELDKLVKAEDLPNIRKHALRICGPAASLGFEPVSKLANNFLTTLDSTMSLEESMVALNAFISVCRSVRPCGRAA